MRAEERDGYRNGRKSEEVEGHLGAMLATDALARFNYTQQKQECKIQKCDSERMPKMDDFHHDDEAPARRGDTKSSKR